jgi:hypothetical protein
MLPEFNQDGNLPEGIYQVTETEVLRRFASSSARRKWLGEKFQELVSVAKATGYLQRVILWGSFISSKESPNDLDVLLVMDADFAPEQLLKDNQLLFDHTQAKLRFQADVFWTKASIGQSIVDLWLDTYQTTKDFKRRGIVEVLVL